MTKWYQSVDGAPGFTNEALQAISLKVIEAEESRKKIVCNLVFYERAMRKSTIEWSGVKTTDYVNVGMNINSDSLPIVTQAFRIYACYCKFPLKGSNMIFFN